MQLDGNCFPTTSKSWKGASCHPPISLVILRQILYLVHTCWLRQGILQILADKLVKSKVGVLPYRKLKPHPCQNVSQTQKRRSDLIRMTLPSAPNLPLSSYCIGQASQISVLASDNRSSSEPLGRGIAVGVCVPLIQSYLRLLPRPWHIFHCRTHIRPASRDKVPARLASVGILGRAYTVKMVSHTAESRRAHSNGNNCSLVTAQ